MKNFEKNSLIDFVNRRLEPSYYEFDCDQLKASKDYSANRIVFFGNKEDSGYSTLTRTSMANVFWDFIVSPAECAE